MSTTAPASVAARVHHRRTRPIDYGFTHRTTMWLVDLADPHAPFPRWLRPLASLRSIDHLTRDKTPLLEKVRTYLRAHDLDWSTDRVLMLANARSLGYVFDPLTTYFCFDGTGQLEGVLAEVHNTYGERHCYPVPVQADRRSVDKDFYVSPFFTVEGRYDIRARLTADKVAIGITLTQHDEVVFRAAVRGDLQPATRRRVVRTVLGNPIPSQRVSALIRLHGIRLWMRRLPVVPRRPHRAREETR